MAVRNANQESASLQPQQKLNIITICHADNWVDTHLKRFVYFALKAMPDAKLYLIVPTIGTETVDKLKPLAKYFTQIKFVKKQEMQGRLLYYDLLRSSVLDIFDIDEGLYADPDVDILDDLSDITILSEQSVLLWAPSFMNMPLIPTALKRNGINAAPPYMDVGFIYMRRSFQKDCEDVLNNYNIDMNSFAPGTAMWNIVCRQSKSYMLPRTWHVTTWGPEYFGKAKAIHFPGPLPKRWRPYISYEHGKMIINPDQVNIDIDNMLFSL